MRALIVLAGLLFAYPVNAEEARCTALGIYNSSGGGATDGNCVCSDPMATNEGGAFINNGHDFADSDDATECMGNRSGVQTYQTSGADEYKMAAVTDWGSVPFAFEQAQGGGFVWLNAANITSGPLAFTSTNRTICHRYYMQIDTVAQGGYAATCDGVPWQARNKLTQHQFLSPSTQIQFQEINTFPCPTTGNFADTVISIGGGVADGNTLLSPMVKLSDCDTAPCRVEMCTDGNLQAGTNLIHRAQLHSIKTGVTGEATTTISHSATPSLPDFWGGDLFHSSSGVQGSARFGHFIECRWDADNNDWCGAATEIEGGNNPTTPTTPKIGVSLTYFNWLLIVPLAGLLLFTTMLFPGRQHT